MALRQTDQDIQNIIRRKLNRDSRISDPSRISVTVDRGLVTLSGFVPNYSQRVAAEEDAWQAPGVIALIDDVQIALPTVRTDAEIAADVREALDRDPAINATRITLSVVDRVVNLDGSVPISTQIPRANEDAWSVPGVRDVVNDLYLGIRPAEAQALTPPAWIGWARFTSLLTILAGGWVAISPFVLDYASLTIPTIANVAVGLVVTICALIRYFEPDWVVWPSWAIAILGLWLAAAPVVLGYTNVSAPTTNDIIMGAVIFALGVAAALTTTLAPGQ